MVEISLPPTLVRLRFRGLFALLTASVGLLLATVTAVAQQPTAVGQDPQAGARAFRAKGCITCHRVRGLGGSPDSQAPDLGRVSGGRSLYELGAAMWNHVPQMTAQMRAGGIERPRLDSWEVGDLAAFLFWLGYFEQPGDTARGGEIFATRRCILCHQVRGSGGVIGPNLDFLTDGSPIRAAAALWNHAPAMAAAMRERGLAHVKFSGQELRDLLAYLGASGRAVPFDPMHVTPGSAEAGERVFQEKACVECHAVRGRGGSVGPQLGAQVEYRSVMDFAAAMWNKAPGMYREMVRRGIEVPRLELPEMADLVAYLYAYRFFGDAGDPERGWRLLESKGCLSCHALAGRGGTSAGDLTATRNLDSPAAVVAALWNHVLVPLDARGAPWPSMSSAEVADVAAALLRMGGSK